MIIWQGPTYKVAKITAKAKGFCLLGTKPGRLQCRDILFTKGFFSAWLSTFEFSNHTGAKTNFLSRNSPEFDV